MRLVVEYMALAARGQESFTVAEPIEYESKEKFLADFQEQLDNNNQIIMLGNKIFASFHFKSKSQALLPEIFTVDEWFARP